MMRGLKWHGRVGLIWMAGVLAARADIGMWNAEFDKLARPLVDQGYTRGVVVAVVDGCQERVFTYGESREGWGLPDSETIFSIGSVTKTFTALVLAEMVERGEVALDDPISKYLPEGISAPEKDGKPITLRHLASHTSGLPRMPTHWAPANPKQPYEDYSAKDLYAFLNDYELSREPGQQYEYSNLGAGLLGHLLARRADLSYERLVIERLCEPLIMTDTVMVVPKKDLRRRAKAHAIDGQPVPRWKWDVLAPCGAFRSTADSLLKYVKAQLGDEKAPLSAAMSLARQPQADSAFPEWKIGLGWHVNDDGDIAWHDGGTYGFYSFVAFNRRKNFGFVWLSNSSLWQVGSLAEQLQRILLWKAVDPLVLKTPVELKPAQLERCVGQYQLSVDVTMEVALVDGYLVLRSPGEKGGSVLYPESETQFFFMEAEDVTVSFKLGDKREVTALVFHEGDESTVAEKK